MAVSVHYKLPPLLKRGFEALSQTQRTSLLKQLAGAQGAGGQGAIGQMRRRTLSGKDIEDTAFQPYSERYAAFKRSTGRGDKVNLSFRARMQKAVRVKSATPNAVTIGMSGGVEATKALAHQVGTKNIPRRAWFGFSPSDKKTLFPWFTKIITALIEKRLKAK